MKRQAWRDQMFLKASRLSIPLTFKTALISIQSSLIMTFHRYQMPRTLPYLLLLTRDDTEMFGQRSPGKRRSSLTYSRDARARPVRCINDLMSRKLSLWSLSFPFAVENLTLTQTAVDVSEQRGLSLVTRVGEIMQA